MAAPNPRASALMRRYGALHASAAERWRKLAPREQRVLLAAAVVAVLGLVWLAGVQPAWRTWREAPARLAALDVELQTMQALADEASALRAIAPISPSQASAALEAATARLGAAGRLNLQGDRATLTLTGIDSASLREWLGTARSAARARPVEAQLMRSGDGYNGTLVVSIGSPP